MGWWSDVLADAIERSGKLTIAACFSRSAEKREKFASKYRCKAARSYEEILEDDTPVARFVRVFPTRSASSIPIFK